MRIAVCEDEEREREQLLQVLKACEPDQDAECFPNGASLLKAAEKQPFFDIAFLDIYLPGENGVSIAKTLRAQSPDTAIVFCTSSTEYAVDAFSLYALHYLVKPVTEQGVSEVFRRLKDVHVRKRETITITSKRMSHTVYLDQICCLESFQHAVEITLADGQKLKVWGSLSELESKLGRKFLKINRGILVNMDQIAQMAANTCVLQNGARLPVKARNSAVIRAAYDNYIFEQLSQQHDR